MQNRIPEGYDNIKRVDLAQNLRREDKAQHRDLQRRRQLNPHPHLHPTGNIEQQQCQRTEKRAFIAAPPDLTRQSEAHQHPQERKHNERAFMLPQFLLHGFLVIPPLHPPTFFLWIHVLCPPSLTDHNRLVFIPAGLTVQNKAGQDRVSRKYRHPCSAQRGAFPVRNQISGYHKSALLTRVERSTRGDPSFSGAEKDGSPRGRNRLPSGIVFADRLSQQQSFQRLAVKRQKRIQVSRPHYGPVGHDQPNNEKRSPY
ncbi:hypothetical protein SDC9_119016 [bioreactor metagenome]|uniref:Uncharacterized protein n=1 Tax=bioreactor metagenome TaxID=1076179 RepID=A0A645C8G4_9ZZZZ